MIRRTIVSERPAGPCSTAGNRATRRAGSSRSAMPRTATSMRTSLISARARESLRSRWPSSVPLPTSRPLTFLPKRCLARENAMRHSLIGTDRLSRSESLPVWRGTLRPDRRQPALYCDRPNLRAFSARCSTIRLIALDGGPDGLCVHSKAHRSRLRLICAGRNARPGNRARPGRRGRCALASSWATGRFGVAQGLSGRSNGSLTASISTMTLSEALSGPSARR